MSCLIEQGVFEGIQSSSNVRKIIHIDMDCYFVAIEMRDNPALKGKPVAVGGSAEQRGVLSTCSYEARKYGLHSGMATSFAFKKCPNLILLPVDIEKYKIVSKKIHAIFKEYTPFVEMFSLDEAFLDVTNSPHCKGSATLIAQAIKDRIHSSLNLTASAGVAPNKFLAKVASDWKKPDGLFVIRPSEVAEFVFKLPVTKIFGVGKVTAKKLESINVKTCGDLQNLPLDDLCKKFGKMGGYFYNLCRGNDLRPVKTETIRKSLSVEETFPKDLYSLDQCLFFLSEQISRLTHQLKTKELTSISKQFIKIKFYDFKQITAETRSDQLDEDLFVSLFKFKYESYKNKPIRLLGVGVRFKKFDKSIRDSTCS